MATFLQDLRYALRTLRRTPGFAPVAVLSLALEMPETGTVEEGKRAALVLVDANPLEDVANAERIAGVMVRGRWLPRAELDAALERIEPRFQAAFGE